LGLQPIYDLDTGEPRLRRTGPANLPPHTLLVMDECFMVGRELYAHLLRLAARENSNISLCLGDGTAGSLGLKFTNSTHVRRHTPLDENWYFQSRVRLTGVTR
jgi:hypothetical protein